MDYERSERPERRVNNSLVSGSFVLCNKEDKKILSMLVVKTGSATENSSSDVWQYFGPLYCKFVRVRKSVFL